MSTASVARVDVADYLALEATAETKHEFVNGEIVAMAGATLEHEAVKVGLSTALVAALVALIFWLRRLRARRQAGS